MRNYLILLSQVLSLSLITILINVSMLFCCYCCLLLFLLWLLLHLFCQYCLSLQSVLNRPCFFFLLLWLIIITFESYISILSNNYHQLVSYMCIHPLFRSSPNSASSASRHSFFFCPINEEKGASKAHGRTWNVLSAVMLWRLWWRCLD